MRKASRKEKIAKVIGSQLVIHRDDFSISASLVEDPMFWIRLEPGPDEHLEVTDLVPGAQTSAVVAEALRSLVSRPSDVRKVSLRDVLPNWRERPARAVELEERLTGAQDIVALAFNNRGAFMVEMQIIERSNKLDAVFELIFQAEE